MALVKIVYAVTPDRLAPDLDRIGTVEDFDPDVARRMVHEGSGVWPTAEDLAAMPPAVPPEPVEAAPAPDDLTGLSKAELRERLPVEADVPLSATKDELIAAVLVAQAGR